MTEALVSALLANGGAVVAGVIFAAAVACAVAVLAWRAGVITASVNAMKDDLSDISDWVKEHEEKCSQRNRALHEKIDKQSEQLNRLIGRLEK